MTIACNERRKLRDVVVAYMDGTISTFAFDDRNCDFMDSRDAGVRRLSKLLYQIHDDTVDHPISVSETTWKALLRIVAFLDTDMPLSDEEDNPFWPFQSEADWNEHRNTVEDANIPPYDPSVHSLPVHGPFDRIPTLVGFGIVAVVIGLLCVVLIAAI
jgi:hypothetical protein